MMGKAIKSQRILLKDQVRASLFRWQPSTARQVAARTGHSRQTIDSHIRLHQGILYTRIGNLRPARWSLKDAVS
jgi:hypothetical protein